MSMKRALKKLDRMVDQHYENTMQMNASVSRMRDALIKIVAAETLDSARDLARSAILKSLPPPRGPVWRGSEPPPDFGTDKDDSLP